MKNIKLKTTVVTSTIALMTSPLIPLATPFAFAEEESCPIENVINKSDIAISVIPDDKLVHREDDAIEVNIPDFNLRRGVCELMGYKDIANSKITRRDMRRILYLSPEVCMAHNTSECGVKVKDLTGLEYAENIEKLSMVNQSFNDITPLKGLTKLKHIDLRNVSKNHVPITDVSPLKDLVNLEYLDIYAAKPTNIEELKNLVNLKTLHIGATKTSNLDFVKNMTKLEYLNVEPNNVSDISSLENLVSLKTLLLDGERFNYFDEARKTHIQDISKLKKLVNLEELGLSNHEIQNINVVKNFKKLRKFHATNNKIENAESLLALENLEEVWLGENPLKIEKTDKNYLLAKAIFNKLNKNTLTKEDKVVIEKLITEDPNVAKFFSKNTLATLSKYNEELVNNDEVENKLFISARVDKLEGSLVRISKVKEVTVHVGDTLDSLKALLPSYVKAEIKLSQLIRGKLIKNVTSDVLRIAIVDKGGNLVKEPLEFEGRLGTSPTPTKYVAKDGYLEIDAKVAAVPYLEYHLSYNGKNVFEFVNGVLRRVGNVTSAKGTSDVNAEDFAKYLVINIDKQLEGKTSPEDAEVTPPSGETKPDEGKEEKPSEEVTPPNDKEETPTPEEKPDAEEKPTPEENTEGKGETPINPEVKPTPETPNTGGSEETPPSEEAKPSDEGKEEKPSEEVTPPSGKEETPTPEEKPDAEEKPTPEENTEGKVETPINPEVKPTPETPNTGGSEETPPSEETKPVDEEKPSPEKEQPEVTEEIGVHGSEIRYKVQNENGEKVELDAPLVAIGDYANLTAKAQNGYYVFTSAGDDYDYKVNLNSQKYKLIGDYAFSTYYNTKITETVPANAVASVIKNGVKENYRKGEVQKNKDLFLITVKDLTKKEETPRSEVTPPSEKEESNTENKVDTRLGVKKDEKGNWTINYKVVNKNGEVVNIPGLINAYYAESYLDNILINKDGIYTYKPDGVTGILDIKVENRNYKLVSNNKINIGNGEKWEPKLLDIRLGGERTKDFENAPAKFFTIVVDESSANAAFRSVDSRPTFRMAVNNKEKNPVVDIPVEYDLSKVDLTKEGVYEIFGELALPSGVENPNNLKHKVVVKVEKAKEVEPKVEWSIPSDAPKEEVLPEYPLDKVPSYSEKGEANVEPSLPKFEWSIPSDAPKEEVLPEYPLEKVPSYSEKGEANVEPSLPKFEWSIPSDAPKEEVLPEYPLEKVPEVNRDTFVGKLKDKEIKVVLDNSKVNADKVVVKEVSEKETSKVKEVVATQLKNSELVELFDISLLDKDGKEVVAKGERAVTLAVVKGKDEQLVVYYYNNGGLEEVPSTYKDGLLTFVTNHFSTYAVIKTKFQKGEANVESNLPEYLLDKVPSYSENGEVNVEPSFPEFEWSVPEDAPREEVLPEYPLDKVPSYSESGEALSEDHPNDQPELTELSEGRGGATVEEKEVKKDKLPNTATTTTSLAALGAIAFLALALRRKIIK